MALEHKKELLSLLPETAGGETCRAFLADVSILLCGWVQAQGRPVLELTEENWSDAVRICAQRLAVPVFSDWSPLPRIGGEAAWAVRRLLEELAQETGQQAARRACGQIEGTLGELQDSGRAAGFMVPWPLATLMVQMLAPRTGERVLDPICGSGQLLRAASLYRPDLQLLGLETDRALAVVAAARLWLTLETGWDMNCADFLRQTFEALAGYDVVLANPPYTGDIAQTIRYVEKILGALRPGGRCGILVPEGLLTNAASLKVVQTRRELLRRHTLTAVVSLPLEMYQPYTRSHSSLLVLKKGREESVGEVFFSCVPEHREAGDRLSAQHGADMVRVWSAWERYRRGEREQEGTFPDYWTAFEEEIGQGDCLFAAEAYRPARYVSRETGEGNALEQVLGWQRELEELWSQYREGELGDER